MTPAALRIALNTNVTREFAFWKGCAIPIEKISQISVVPNSTSSSMRAMSCGLPLMHMMRPWSACASLAARVHMLLSKMNRRRRTALPGSTTMGSTSRIGTDLIRGGGDEGPSLSGSGGESTAWLGREDSKCAGRPARSRLC
jgi:hypothetical protein